MPGDAGRAEGAGAATTVFFAALVAAFALYCTALVVLRRGSPRLGAVLAVAAVVQLLPLAAPLLLSTDAWSYWQYGALPLEGANPYRDAPREVATNPAYEHAGAAWRDTTSVYGPAFTLLSEGVARAAGASEHAAAWTFKTLAALAMLAVAALAALLARERGYAAALVGWNPLFAVHFAGGGHNDALMVALVLGALALATSGRRAAAAAAWVVSIAIKWVSVVFFVLRAVEAKASRRPVAHRAFAIAAAAAAGAATLRYGSDWIGATLAAADNAQRRTSYALPSRLVQLGAPESVAFALAVAGLVVGLVLLARRARTGATYLGWAGCLLLATTPYLAAWYAVWAVPLAAVEDDRRAQLVALAFCVYLLPQTIPL
ncbi:MAG TPA: hypothetical protein VNT58_07815 [Gaiellaceae bacterium]|nr:hypothetical protein [Gaiellaceae bacterium]